MASFKKLSKSDVSVVPYHANKQWDLSYTLYPTSSEYLTIYNGTNLTGSFNPGYEPVTEDQYDRLVYSQINQLFYQDYTASLNTSSLASSIYYESASQQRPTSSYFIYNDNARLIDYFPTGTMEGIRVIAINQGIYGEKVLPFSFQLSSSTYFIIDDGYGNLWHYTPSAPTPSPTVAPTAAPTTPAPTTPAPTTPAPTTPAPTTPAPTTPAPTTPAPTTPAPTTPAPTTPAPTTPAPTTPTPTTPAPTTPAPTTPAPTTPAPTTPAPTTPAPTTPAPTTPAPTTPAPTLVPTATPPPTTPAPTTPAPTTPSPTTPAPTLAPTATPPPTTPAPTTPSPTSPPTTPSPTAITCYYFNVSADDGTPNKTNYNFWYTTCCGNAVTSSVVNQDPAKYIGCAREGTIQSDSIYVLAEPSGSCSCTGTPNPTAAPIATPSPTTPAPTVVTPSPTTPAPTTPAPTTPAPTTPAPTTPAPTVVTPSPTAALGNCWSVTEQYGNYSYVSYYDRFGTLQCDTVGPYATVYLCIQPGTENAIQGWDTAGCTGNGVDYYEFNLLTTCSNNGDCVPAPTPAPTAPATPSPTTATPSPTAPATPSPTAATPSPTAPATPSPTTPAPTRTPTAAPTAATPAPTRTPTAAPTAATPAPTAATPAPTAATPSPTAATPSPTAATPAPTVGSFSYNISTVGEASAVDACNNFDAGQTVYAATGNIATVATFYTNSNLTSTFNGGSEWWAYERSSNPGVIRRAIISSGGNLSSAGNC